MVSIGIPQNPSGVGSINISGVDWTNGRLLVAGVAATNIAKLGTLVTVDKDSRFGVEFAGYSAIGNEEIATYWGITPPYLSNSFTGHGSYNPFTQPANRLPWTRVSLDRFWYRHSPSETVLTIGAFDNERMDRLVLRGERNPSITPPEILPFYGINLKGNFTKNKDNNWSYEASYSRLPNASFFSSQMLGGSIIYNYDKVRVRGHYMYAKDNPFGDDSIYINPNTLQATLMPSYPLAPGNAIIYWQNRFGVVTNPSLGPQQLGIFGVDVDYKVAKNWQLVAKGAFSSYNPDTSKTLFLTTASGAAGVIGVRAKYDKVDGGLQYQYVNNTYDPFMLQYPGPGSGIPVFLPYSTYYFNYYQLHDYLAYPSNRQGLKFDIGYNFTPCTRAEFNTDYLRQVKPSTIANFTTVGNIEPLFPYLQTPGSTARGDVFDWGIRLKHDFNNKWHGGIGYYNYVQRRSTAAVDDISLKEDLAYLNLKYKVTPSTSLYGNYYYLNYKGHLGLINTGFKQHIPSITAETNITPDIQTGLTYRYYNFRNTLDATQDWRANQLMVNWKFNF
jgi:predicted porin